VESQCRAAEDRGHRLKRQRLLIGEGPDAAEQEPSDVIPVPDVIFEALDDDALCAEVQTTREEEETMDFEEEEKTESFISRGSQTEIDVSEQGCQTEGGTSSPLLSIHKFEGNPEMIKFYTGFDNYEHFLYVYRCPGPAAEELKYKSKALDTMNEFFLCILKLCQDKEDMELGFLFGVLRVTAGRVFNTWLNLIYFQLKQVQIFLPKETVSAYMPEDFKQKFPNTRIILDATEIKIQKPSNVRDQRSTWSSYKNGNTLKTMVGTSPRGVVTYVSTAFGGSASDRQTIEASELLNGMFSPGDSIMADR
jgi:hypothetical protein